MEVTSARRSRTTNEIHDDTFTNGTIGPSTKMLGPLADGGKIVFETAPGCWGPMITPTIRGGHEVCTPVAIEGADVGDSVAIKVESISIQSKAASVGVDESREGCFRGSLRREAVSGVQGDVAELRRERNGAAGDKVQELRDTRFPFQDGQRIHHGVRPQGWNRDNSRQENCRRNRQGARRGSGTHFQEFKAGSRYLSLGGPTLWVSFEDISRSWGSSGTTLGAVDPGLSQRQRFRLSPD